MRLMRTLAICLLCATAAVGRSADLSTELSFVPSNALLVVTIDLPAVMADVKLRPIVDVLTTDKKIVSGTLKTVGLPFDQFARVTVVIVPPPAGQKAVLRPFAMVCMTTKKPLDKPALLKAVQAVSLPELRAAVVARREALKKNAPRQEMPKATGKLDGDWYLSLEEKTVLTFLNDHTFAWTGEAALRNVFEKEEPAAADFFPNGQKTNSYAKWLKTAGAAPVTFAANMTNVRTHMPEDEGLPEAFRPLLRCDFVNGQLTSGRDEFALSGTGTFAGKRWASEAEEAANTAKALLVVGMKTELGRSKDESADFKLLLSTVAKAADKVSIRVEETTLRVSGTLPFDQKMQDAFGRMPKDGEAARVSLTTQNNLKQIGLAMHTYHDTYMSLPTNTVDKAGRPLLSWRVHLLPYLEQEALYKQFKLDEAWDSDHNKKLIEKMPKVYRSDISGPKNDGTTAYRAFVSKPGKVRAFLVQGAKLGAKMPSDFPDGTSNCLLCVEAAEPCIWTQPDDLPFDPNGTLPKLGQSVNGGFNALLADGSVRFFKSSIDPKKLKALITLNGGEVVESDQ